MRQILSLTLSVILCLVALAALLCLVDDPARARSSARFVAPTGFDFGPCTDPRLPCRTVQYAVDQATSGDVIKVATGVYNDVNNYGGLAQVVYIDKTVTIRGGYSALFFADPPDPEANPTTLDAEGRGRVLYITGNINPTVEGLSITGGDADGLGGDWQGRDAGSGIYVIGASVSFNSNLVFNNVGSYRGGGMYLSNSDAMIEANTISANKGSWGGGGFLYKSHVTLDSNTVVANHASGGGGGLFLYRSEGTLEGNVITDSMAYRGGGLYFHESKAVLSDNMICSNLASGGTTSDGGGGVYTTENTDILLSNNTFSNNRAGAEGGALRFYVGTTATLTHNVVVSNHSEGSGGGITIDFSKATIGGNTIISNRARWGGGLAFDRSRAEVYGNIIMANTAWGGNGSGGGVALGTTSATLINNLVADNEAGTHGSGVYIDSSVVRVEHNTIARNSGGDSGIYATGNILWPFSPTSVAVINTIVVSHPVGIRVGWHSTATLEATLWDNDADWAGEGDIFTGTINIWGASAFVDPDAGDYHIGPGSAALDQGVDAGVNKDIDRQRRPYQAPDLGADEYWPPGVVKRVYLPLILRNAP